MTKKCLFLLIVFFTCFVHAEEPVIKVDFLEQAGMTINSAGPLLVQMDTDRNRLIVANTLSSSLSIIDGSSHAVKNIPLSGRALQHLKAESMTIRRKTGDVYLMGTECFHMVSPDSGKSNTVSTGAQFSSIAVDEATGNVFIAGRESKSLGFYDAATGQLVMLAWLDTEEPLINLNATPPPPIRKVIADSTRQWIIAVDGYTSTLFVFDAGSGEPLRARPVPLTGGGRWHLAGYDEGTHCLYLVTETDERKVIEAAKIDVAGGEDTVVSLPEFTEGVGIIYNPVRDEVYVSYDNHPSVHVVDFKSGGRVEEIKIPAYGNDASAVDVKNHILYIGSWAFGEVDVVDLKTRKLVKRIKGLGIIPHMFTMAFNPNNNTVYFPKGATAVNGTFGTAVTALDPVKEESRKIYLGWSPVDLIALEGCDCFLVFNSEDAFAEVKPDGTFTLHKLPFDYPVRAIPNPEGNIYLSYGPHQSYWPTVYIWDAKNGVLTIDAGDLGFYDRRIPRQSHEMVLDRDGVLYFTQNNWGREEQFLGVLEDAVRVFEAKQRLTLGDEVEREITQRILRYDADLHRLYLVRVGEKDGDPSLLQVIDAESKEVVWKTPLGLTTADMIFDTDFLYAANFDSNTVSIIDKKNFTAWNITTGEKPLRLCRCRERVYVINHLGNSLQEVKEKGRVFQIPWEGTPDNIFAWDQSVIITSHSRDALFILQFDPGTNSITLLHEEKYPYGDTSFDTNNVSFYLRGQFGDAIFSLTKGQTDQAGRLWITDFLSGKLFILGDSTVSVDLKGN